MMPSKIRTYIQDRPREWFKENPTRKWRCDIYTDEGYDYHGEGPTEADALVSASTFYLGHYNEKLRPTVYDIPKMTQKEVEELIRDLWPRASHHDFYKGSFNVALPARMDAPHNVTKGDAIVSDVALYATYRFYYDECQNPKHIVGNIGPVYVKFPLPKGN